MSGYGTQKKGGRDAVQLGFPAVYQTAVAAMGSPMGYADSALAPGHWNYIGEYDQARIHAERKRDADYMARAKVQSTINSDRRARLHHCGVAQPRAVLSQRIFANPSFGALPSASARQDYRDAPFNFEGSGYEGSGMLTGGVMRTKEGAQFLTRAREARLSQLAAIDAAKQEFVLGGIPGGLMGAPGALTPAQPGATISRLPTQGLEGAPESTTLEITLILQNVEDSLTGQDAENPEMLDKITNTEAQRVFSLIFRFAPRMDVSELTAIKGKVDSITEQLGTLATNQGWGAAHPSAQARATTLETLYGKLSQYLTGMIGGISNDGRTIVKQLDPATGRESDVEVQLITPAEQGATLSPKEREDLSRALVKNIRIGDVLRNSRSDELREAREEEEEGGGLPEPGDDSDGEDGGEDDDDDGYDIAAGFGGGGASSGGALLRPTGGGNAPYGGGGGQGLPGAMSREQTHYLDSMRYYASRGGMRAASELADFSTSDGKDLRQASMLASGTAAYFGEGIGLGATTGEGADEAEQALGARASLYAQRRVPNSATRGLSAKARATGFAEEDEEDYETAQTRAAAEGRIAHAEDDAEADAMGALTALPPEGEGEAFGAIARPRAGREQALARQTSVAKSRASAVAASRAAEVPAFAEAVASPFSPFERAQRRPVKASLGFTDTSSSKSSRKSTKSSGSEIKIKSQGVGQKSKFSYKGKEYETPLLANRARMASRAERAPAPPPAPAPSTPSVNIFGPIATIPQRKKYLEEMFGSYHKGLGATQPELAATFRKIQAGERDPAKLMYNWESEGQRRALLADKRRGGMDFLAKLGSRK